MTGGDHCAGLRDPRDQGWCVRMIGGGASCSSATSPQACLNASLRHAGRGGYSYLGLPLIHSRFSGGCTSSLSGVQQNIMRGPIPRARERWTRADIINGVGVVIALLVAIIPESVNFYHDHFDSPRASITSIKGGEHIPNNKIAVSGNSQHVSADSDLWLTVSGPSDQVYPIAELPINTKWTATEKQACFLIGPGTQRLDVWIAPDTNDGAFVGFMQEGKHTSGFNSAPSGFVKAGQVTIYVQNVLSHC
jgi:hypothetical protein